MAKVTELDMRQFRTALAQVERAEQKVGACKMLVHLLEMQRGGRQEEVMELLLGAEEALLQAHDQAGDASEELLNLVDPNKLREGRPILQGDAAEG